MKRWAEALPVTLLYAVLTFILAYPLSLHPGTRVLPQGSDTDLMLWIFGWDVHALTHQPLALFDANIYYPYRHTLAYAENLIGSAVLSAPIVWLTGNLVLAMNAAALLSCVLCGVGMYVLARRLGLGPAGAVIAGLVFAFAPPRFFRLGQLHLTTVQWLPFCLAFLHGYLESGDKRDLRWALAFFVFQVFTSGHGAVLTAVSILLLIAWRLVLGEPPQLLKRLRDLGVPGAAMLVTVVLFVLPYRAVQQEMGLRRSLSESYLFAPNAESFLASPSYVDQFLTSKLTDAPVLDRARALLFPGYLTLVLAAVGVWSIKLPFRAERQGRATAWMRSAWAAELALAILLILGIVVMWNGGVRIRRGSAVIFSARQPLRIWLQCAAVAAVRLALVRVAPIDAGGRIRRLGHRLRRWADGLRAEPAVFFLLLALITFWLALGPGFGLYASVHDWPGFSFIRVPSRFTILTLLALAILAGRGFERVTASAAPRQRLILTTLAGFLLVGEFAAFPLNTIPYAADRPSIDRWLATQPTPFVVAELPVEERLQGLYMVHSTAHWQKTVHGYSGLRPPLHSALYDEMRTFPDERSLKSFASLGVTYVVIHTGLYPPGEWPLVEERLRNLPDWLTLSHVEGDGRVYALHRAAMAPDAAP